MDLPSRISKSSLSKFNSLPKTGKPLEHKEWTVLSTIVQHNTESDKITVVSLGTGTKCLTKDDLLHEGTKINDSHAEIMARRGFFRYLYEQIALRNSHQETIFEENLIDNKLQLKSNIEFHFFTTHLPCGDASISHHTELGPPEAKRARLEEKLDDEKYFTGARLISTEHEDTMAQISGVRTKPGRGIRTASVSCSDKMLKWNLLGIQGALLNTLKQNPIYLKSIVLIGYPKEMAEMSLKRAIIERYESKFDFLKSPFKRNDLEIHVLPNHRFTHAKDDGLSPCPSSIVWCLCKDRSHEVAVNGKKLGATKKQKGPKGRLLISKIEIMRSYLNILNEKEDFKCALFENEDDLTNLDYDDLKNRSKLYKEQWKILLDNCIKEWTKKPDNMNKFKLID